MRRSQFGIMEAEVFTGAAWEAYDSLRRDEEVPLADSLTGPSAKMVELRTQLAIAVSLLVIARNTEQHDDDIQNQ